MGNIRRKSGSISKKRLWRFAACLLLFYLVADVSVLEYFCGNPELGIESYTQVVKKVSTNPEVSKTDFVKNSSELPKHDDDSDLPLDGDDCFCCCSHALQSVFIVVNRLSIIEKHIQNPFVRQMKPNPHLSDYYRPPRFA